MTPTEIQILKDGISEHIADTIKITVNGKIDAMRNDLNEHNTKHEEDMKRIMPVIEDFESAQQGGRFVLKVAGVITLIGGTYLVIRQIFTS